ncbi:MAG: helix-turn-helix transcriptional regulator [Chitinophagales bacterium]
MGTRKTHLFPSAQNEIAAISRAFGHPARLEIINLLLENKTISYVHILDAIPLASATIWQHIDEMKAAELLYCFEKDKLLHFQLNELTLTKLRQFHLFIAHKLILQQNIPIVLQ